MSVMLSRDADSRLTNRGRIAVDDWLASDENSHIMRDHLQHGAEMLGGIGVF